MILDEPLEAMDRAIREEILAWVDCLLRSGAAVLIATHQIEPFAESTTRALATCEGTWTMVEPLPADHLERRTLLESLSRSVARLI